jgi:hypothetical protein
MVRLQVSQSAVLLRDKPERDAHARHGAAQPAVEQQPAGLRRIDSVLAQTAVEQGGVEAGGESDGQCQSGVCQPADQDQVQPLGYGQASAGRC